jgi:hypothetical protein
MSTTEKPLRGMCRQGWFSRIWVVEKGSGQRVIQGVKQFADGDLVDAGAMFEGLQVGDLALVAVEIELLENGKGFGMLPDDIGDNHVFGYHGEHLVVSVRQQ